MPNIRFRLENGDIGSVSFPVTLQELKTWFPTGKMKLLNNKYLPCLSLRDNQVVNPYEMNVFCRVYESLSHKNTKKLNALCHLKPNLSLNELMHHVKYLNHYGLICSFEEYTQPSLLARELCQQYYLDAFYHMLQGEDDSEEAWIKRGQQALQDLTHELTPYGWLFILDENIPTLSKNQLVTYNLNQPAMLTVKIESTKSSQVMNLELPQSDFELEEQLYRFDSYGIDNLVFDYQNKKLDSTLWHHLKESIQKSAPIEVNELLLKLQDLNTFEIEKLKNILTLVSVEDTKRVNCLIDSLDAFEFQDGSLSDLKSYGKNQLLHYLNSDFELFKNYMDQFMDYQGLGEYLIQENCLIEIPNGILKVPDAFNHFIQDSKKAFKEET